MKFSEEEKLLNEDNGIGIVRTALTSFPVTAAAVIGLDKKPKAYPAEFCFEQDGTFYFAAAKCETFYAALSMKPDFELISFDPESGFMIRIDAKAEFTEDESVISRMIECGCTLCNKYSGEPEMLIAYFPTAVTISVESMTGAFSPKKLGIGESGALVGIKLKKDRELRDRISKLIDERAALTPTQTEKDMHRQKLYDGALLYFAEKAKELFPRMNILSIEQALVFDTYDERESYVQLVKKLIGNRTVDKPEDLTYYINIETLEELKANA